jgi:hypothetical protein
VIINYKSRGSYAFILEKGAVANKNNEREQERMKGNRYWKRERERERRRIRKKPGKKLDIMRENEKDKRK